jgi:ribosomal protein S18 acetylase RimI-like enzyme
MNGETAVGIVAGLVDRNDPSLADLLSMWVAPTHRHLGIGRTLVEAILNWAHKQGVTTLRLLVTSNNVPAIKFYQSLGFSHTGHSKSYANDPALRDLEMVRPLPP